MKSQSLTLTEITNLISDYIEDGNLIGIIVDKNLATIIEKYLDSYELNELHNVLNDFILPENRNDDFLITVDCKDGNYNYFIDFYKLNNRIDINFDFVYVLGKKFEDFNPMTVRSKGYLISGDVDINQDELNNVFDNDEDYNNEDSCDEGNDKCNECCCDCSEEVDLLIEYTNRILDTQGCPNCVLNIVIELANNMKEIGWKDCEDSLSDEF